ncbi:hypothetical protein BZG36_01319 [Bifiguratus adelaidae]|uniref:Uncharacterized protein n=1 Tax=Bifiguratus adelaidae TaxID=1938954 RepID=A0A261Y542_9FUNG|nr:hypothetical protein BZG36_01319 [Bifiguratus adelaidae]
MTFVGEQSRIENIVCIAFNVFNIILYILVITASCLIIASTDFAEIIICLYTIIGSLLLIFCEVKIPKLVNSHFLFLCTYRGRGFLYLLLGCIILRRDTFNLVIGVISSAWAISHIILSYTGREPRLASLSLNWTLLRNFSSDNSNLPKVTYMQPSPKFDSQVHPMKTTDYSYGIDQNTLDLIQSHEERFLDVHFGQLALSHVPEPGPERGLVALAIVLVPVEPALLAAVPGDSLLHYQISSAKERFTSHPTPFADVKLEVFFPNASSFTKTLAQNRVNQLAIDFVNKDKSVFDIQHISGVLLDPSAPLDGTSVHVIENLTAYTYQHVSRPQETTTLPFIVQPKVGPSNVSMVLVVDFQDQEGTHYRAVAYNGTLEIFEDKSGFWHSSVVQNTILALSVVAILYLFGQAVAEGNFDFMLPAGWRATVKREANAMDAKARKLGEEAKNVFNSGKKEAKAKGEAAKAKAEPLIDEAKQKIKEAVEAGKKVVAKAEQMVAETTDEAERQVESMKKEAEEAVKEEETEPAQPVQPPPEQSSPPADLIDEKGNAKKLDEAWIPEENLKQGKKNKKEGNN